MFSANSVELKTSLAIDSARTVDKAWENLQVINSINPNHNHNQPMYNNKVTSLTNLIKLSNLSKGEVFQDRMMQYQVNPMGILP